MLPPLPPLPSLSIVRAGGSRSRLTNHIENQRNPAEHHVALAIRTFLKTLTQDISLVFLVLFVLTKSKHLENSDIYFHPLEDLSFFSPCPIGWRRNMVAFSCPITEVLPCTGLRSCRRYTWHWVHQRNIVSMLGSPQQQSETRPKTDVFFKRHFFSTKLAAFQHQLAVRKAHRYSMESWLEVSFFKGVPPVIILQTSLFNMLCFMLCFNHGDHGDWGSIHIARPTPRGPRSLP